MHIMLLENIYSVKKLHYYCNKKEKVISLMCEGRKYAMLKEFRVKNFRCFHDWLIFKLDSVRDYEFSKECIKNGIINKAVIYGANSSGKSNLGFAIMDISTHLFDGINNLPYSNYLSLDSAETEATFVYVFKFDEDIIEYTYRKDRTRKLIFEEIKENGELVFQYNYINQKIVNNMPYINTLKFENNTANISMVKFIYNNSDLPNNSSIKRIVDFASNMLWFRSVRNFQYVAPNIGVESISDFIINNNLLGELQEFFNENGLDYKLNVYNELGKAIIIAVFQNGSAPLLEVASTGTMSLWLFFYWMHRNSHISFLFIDEFDAFYHFNLSKSILMSTIKNSKFQSILTTHNTYLCDNDIMRPDCYFIIEDKHITSLADSTKKVIRQGHNLEKMMISGEFK